MKRPAVLSLAAAVALVVAAVTAVYVDHHLQRAPVSVHDAGLTGEAWVMPGDKVSAFLKQHGAPAARLVLGREDTVVVGHVAWTGRTGRPRDERFTVLLGDDNGGAGAVEEVLGGEDLDVALGWGSEWNSTTEHTPWLRGNAPVHLQSSSWTDYGQFASLPVSRGGFVWFVGRVTDTPTDGSPPTVQTEARPVVGVALSTGSRVWWVSRLASATRLT